MPRSCTICAHPEKAAIDRAIVGGASNRSAASLYDVSEAAVRRHGANHLPAKLVKAQEVEDVVEADDLLAEVRGLQARALSILSKAEKAGELRTALGAIREARGNLELLAKLLGELNDSPTVNITISAEWIQVRTVLLAALAPYPDARSAVAGELLKLEEAKSA